jgi:uncharacterized RDD family membrane protein YckC
MPNELVATRPPRLPFWRRGVALLIDLVAVGLVSSIVGSSWLAQAIVFIPLWLALRVVLVSRNHGQSLGRWALDMRVADIRRGSTTPELKELTKREGLLGIEAFLAFVGLVSFNPATPWAPLCFLPLLVDFSAAFTDLTNQQTFHDRLAGTLIVPTRRGYSLDLKIKKFLVDARSRMK